MYTNEATDEELVRAFRGGEARAFDALLYRYQHRVFRLASVWLFDEQQVGDATQEVFLRSHKSLRSFRFRSSVYTWLFRITRNVCHEINRRHQPSAPDRELIDSQQGPADIAMSKQRTARVRELVAKLPERQREVVVLRLFEGLSVRDTANIMAAREGTVKALLHKASSRLRIDLTEMGVDLK